MNTSIQAYQEVLSSGKDKTQRGKILSVIVNSKKPLSAHDIAKKCDLKFLQVNRRLSELVKQEVIKHDGTKHCTDRGRTLNCYSSK